MALHSMNSSLPGAVNRPRVQQQTLALAAPPPAKTPEKKSSRLPDRLHSSFESSGSVGSEFSKKYGSDTATDLSTPKLPSKGLLGKVGKVLDKLPKVGVSKEFEHGVAVAKAEGSFSTADGKVSGGYEASVLEASVGGKAEASFGHGAAKVNGEVHAQATLVDASAHVEAKLGPASASGQAEAWVGGKANAQGGLTIDPVHGKYGVEGKAGAFVGARGGVSGDVRLGKHASAHGSVEGWVGAGIKVGGSASWEKGHLKLGFELGAALGIGGKISFGIDINFKKIKEGIKNVIQKPIQVAKDVSKKVGDFFKDGAEKVGDGFKKAGEKIVDGLKDTGQAIKGGLKKAGKTIKGWFS